MSYMYNTPNCNIYNGLPGKEMTNSFGAKDSSRPVVGAPSYIPKYSIENELNKRDEYRKNFRYDSGNKIQSRSSALPKVAIISSAAAIALLAMSKSK